MLHIHEIVPDGIFEDKFKVWYMTSESWQWSLLNLKVIGKGKSLTTFCVGVSSDVMVICPCVLDHELWVAVHVVFWSPEKKMPYRNYLNVPILKQAMVDVYVCLSRISQRIKSGQVYDRYWYVPVVSHWFNQSQALNKATTTCRVLYQPYVIRDVGLVEFHSIAPHITLPKTKMDTPKWWFWKGNSWKHGNCWYLC